MKIAEFLYHKTID